MVNKYFWSRETIRDNSGLGGAPILLGNSMISSAFTTGWSVRPHTSPFADASGEAAAWTPVTLPHDALIGLSRHPDSPQGVNGGFFPGGAFEYEKQFDVPAEWRHRRVAIVFEGVYRDAMVFVNRDFAGQRAYGYSQFTLELDPFLRYGQTNTIRVEARAHQDSRWYSGAGIHRNVQLLVGNLVHVAPQGVVVTTPQADADHAVVAVATTVRNREVGTITARVRTTVVGPDGRTITEDEVPVTLRSGESGVVRARVRVESPALWSVDDPQLHTVRTTLMMDGESLEETTTSFGIRTLQLDPVAGLRINGVPVKLRGTCIHHDNGVLGAAALPRAEERRVELLKAAGFNAIRSAHNPISPALLDACDRLGMLVMDEAFDVWTESKTDHDYASDFPTWWRRDLAAMVAKDINHPSVILYSTGNEIFETGSSLGAGLGRQLAEALRALDPTRYVTNGINAAIAVLPYTRQVMAELSQGRAEQDFNAMLGAGPEIFNTISAADITSERVEESFSVLDVIGLNYGDARYDLDAQRSPHRVLFGSETFGRDIARNWPRIEQMPHVLGDFTWTGWDYLGESGIGRPHYREAGDGVQGQFPWLSAWCGDIDITGHRRPISYLREIIFGRRAEPYLAVLRPERFGAELGTNGWGWSDSVSTWTWNVPVRSPIEVEVYSDADEVELIVAGTSLGREPAGREHGFVARFRTQYVPGTIEAVAYRAGLASQRTALTTADDEITLTAEADRSSLRADPDDAAFISVELHDRAGIRHTAADRRFAVSLDGPAVLAGLGSADPTTLESFIGSTTTTYEGRALAVVRPTGRPGPVTVTVTAEGLTPARVRIVTV